MRLIAAFFLFIVLLPASAQAREKLLDIHEVASPKGLKAWLVEDHSVPVIALQFSFKGTGAVNDPADKQGLAHLASNTMDEGAGDLDSQRFQKELSDKAIELSFNAGRDHFGGTLKTLTKNKSRAFELLRMALTQPRFDAEPVERMRRANQARIRSALSDPDWMAARLLNDVAFAGHPYAQNSGGTLTTLGNIAISDLQNFSRTLSRDRLVVAAAGDVTPAELAGMLDSLFGALPETAPLPEAPMLTQQNQGKIFLYQRDIPQTVVGIIQPGINMKDPDYQSAQVMNFILGSSGFGSRLMKEIREKRGLTYGIYTDLTEMDKFDGLSVSTSTVSASVAQVLSLIQEEWKKMQEMPVTQAELDNAKSYLTGALPLSLTSTDDIAALMLSLQLDGLPVDYLDRREAGIEAASIQDVQRVAQRILKPESLTTVLVGKPDGAMNAQKIETLPNAE